MSKFFVSPEDVRGDDIYIYDKEDVNHIIKVLRLSENDIIMVCDGVGQDYRVSIEQISKTGIKTKLLGSEVSASEPPVRVTLFQGVPKGGKMEYIIQKTTELGIYQIVPVTTNRTVVKLDRKKSQDNKLQRWQRVAYEAAKQSNRGRIPEVCEPITFEQAVQQMAKMDMKLIPYEKEQCNQLREVLKSRLDAKNIGIFIGPEGGFSDEELQLAKASGLSSVSLGPRILRTETAGMATLAIVMYEMGGI